MSSAKYVSNSSNTKLGIRPVDTTYVTIKGSCPTSCQLKDGNGCYAENYYVGLVVNKLDTQALGLTTLQVAREEAKAIDQSYDSGSVPMGRDMRLHVSGDSRTIKGTKLINSSVGRWKKRGGGDCWTYTHAWMNVPRSTWSHVSVLASIDKAEDAAEARKMGYAPAIVVSEFASAKAFTLPGSDVKYIPCPAQTSPGGKDIGCTECRLCFNADRLFQGNFGIAFSAHGVRKNKIKRRLTVI